MPTFDPNEWKSQVAARWREWAGDTQAAMARLGVKSAYGMLAASAWLPLLVAYAQDVGPAVAALTGLTAGVVRAGLVPIGFSIRVRIDLSVA